jgi:hypothetical protein
MKSCCDEQGHDCLQARDCPIYKAKRRVRAGQPVPDDVTLWVRDTAELEAELERQWKSDLKAIVFVAACVLAFFLVVWGTLP